MEREMTVTTYFTIDEAKRMHDEQMAVYDFIKEHGRAITFRWRSTKYGPFPGRTETEVAWVGLLRSEGYVPPKWWQVSRWGEEKPPKEVLAALKEQTNA